MPDIKNSWTALLNPLRLHGRFMPVFIAMGSDSTRVSVAGQAR